MSNDTAKSARWTSGRGGKRAGAGRPGSGPVWRHAVALTHDEGIQVEALALAQGITKHAWLVQAIRRALAEQWPNVSAALAPKNSPTDAAAPEPE